MVREMLDTILADLHNHGFSQADDADAKGVRPTDGNYELSLTIFESFIIPPSSRPKITLNRLMYCRYMYQ